MAGQDRDFEEMEARALFLLRRPEHLEPRETLQGLEAQVCLWVSPAHKSCASWSLFAEKGSLKPPFRARVREAVWDRPSDSVRLIREPLEGTPKPWRPHPTIKVRDAEVAGEQVVPLLQKGKFLRVPVVRVGHERRHESTSYGLVAGQARLEWFDKGPPEWAELLAWAVEFRAFVLERLANPARK